MVFRSLLMSIHRDTAELRARPSQTICADAAIGFRNLEYAYLKDKDKDSLIDELGLCRTETKTKNPQLPLPVSQSSPISNRLSNFLSTVFEPYGLKAQHWSNFEQGLMKVDLRLGFVVARSWCEERRALYTEVLSKRAGYCISSSIRLRRLIPGNLSMAVFVTYRSYNPFQVSLKWHMKASRILEFDSLAYSACERGDWALLKRLFVQGKASLSDSTIFGDTVLHVSI